MRKKLAALLCALLCITAFTGCSATELDYLKMSVDLMQSAGVCKVSGTTDIALDVDGLKTFAAKVATEAGAKSEADEALAVLQDFTGKKNVTLSYDMTMEMDTLKYVMAIDVKYDGKTYDLGDFYFADGMYVSSSMVLGLLDLYKDLADVAEGSYLLNDAFNTALKAELDQTPYISLLSAAEMQEMQAGSDMFAGNMKELYDSVLKFYTDAFSGFTTGMVSEIPGGYKIAMNGKAVAQLALDFMDYFAANPTVILDAATTYMLDCMKFVNATEEEIAAFESEMAEAAADTEGLKAAIAEIKAVIEEAAAMPAVVQVLDSFSYEATMVRSGAAYVSDEVFSIKDGNTVVLNSTSKSRMSISAGSVAAPTGSVSVDEIGEKIASVSNAYNPVVGVTAMWGWSADASEAMLTTERADIALFGAESTITPFVVQEGRAYLPLREICNDLGETVTWNKAERTAYIVRDGESIAMQGVLQDGKSFVSVRDFEKLGYTVEYKSVDGLKEASIMK